ncbi:hypothetical protein [Streptomyces sp. NPDC006997]|uniref:hypothetical protein n=1 Tax=Streptomyces sp. NPDC006997 TaxID=3155356 RepID=UPI0033D6C10F
MERFEGQPNAERSLDQRVTTEVDLDELVQAVPQRLADFLARLAYLTPVGQRHALDALGPGSRLVLEALRLTETGPTGELTERGRLLSERLANEWPRPASAVPDDEWSGGRLRRIARVVPVGDRGKAAAATAPEQRSEDRVVTYGLSPDSGTTEASVEVFRVDGDYWLWQRSGTHDVVVVDSMEALPRSDEPYVLANPDAEPPSILLRDKLGLSRGGHG